MTTLPPVPYVVVISGNPRPGSRTLSAAKALAHKIAGEFGIADIVAVDLATFSGEIFSPERPTADQAKETISGARAAVVATPVYKASYTGLLKSFLDLFEANALAGLVSVPLVTSGSPAHTLAGEVHLRPVLVELGSVVPTRSLVLTETELSDVDAAIHAWWERSAEPLRLALGLPSSVTR
ncbi:NADPH-dependent FMN reductase [Arthrobacter sp. Z4-13]